MEQGRLESHLVLPIQILNLIYVFLYKSPNRTALESATRGCDLKLRVSSIKYWHPFEIPLFSRPQHRQCLMIPLVTVGTTLQTIDTTLTDSNSRTRQLCELEVSKP